MRIAAPLKLALHAAAGRLGLRVARIAPATDSQTALAALLREHGVDLVLDVGANEGQFASGLLERGFSGRIVSFEPLAAIHARLALRSRTFPGWEIAERCCLGDRDGEVVLQVANESIASSLVGTTPEMERFAPGSRFVAEERAPIYRLDALAPALARGSRAPFLKVDVQGFEEQVLAGARETLPRLAGLQLELSLVRLYAGQALFSQMLRDVEAMGFGLYHLCPAFVDVRDGRWLQADAVFFRG